MNLTLERTPIIIAAEINSIKDQTRKMVLFNSIEIGRRLAEAKSIVAHGEWGKWLEESVDYSQSTANNLMRIFEEYGSDQLAFFDNNAKSQALGNLSYTQAVCLLGVPQEEREAFIQEQDIDNMSTRELQQAIKEAQELKAKLLETEEAKKAAEEGWGVARSEAEKLREIKDNYSERFDELAEINKETEETVERLKKELEEAKAAGNDDEIDRLQEDLEKADKELAQSNKRIEELELQLKEKAVNPVTEPFIEKIPEEVEKELNELREKTKELEAKANQQGDKAVLKFTVHFESLVKGFSDLLNTLSEIRTTDPEGHEKYKKAVTGLIVKMSERL